MIGVIPEIDIWRATANVGNPTDSDIVTPILPNLHGQRSAHMFID
jgi:hypothetical protein